MRTRLLLPLSVLIVLALAACGGSSGTSSSPTTVDQGRAVAPTTTGHVAIPVSNRPSTSAKMICEPEAQKDIYESATGVKTTSLSTPTWVDHVYSCDYVYAGGATMRLSVKELSNEAETTAYFDSLATKLHKASEPVGLPNSFHVEGGSVVVRKDYKVLLVDVSKLPANFGVPTAPRADVATNVAATIMGCWTGE